jgi:hypothetical protein
VSLARRYSAGGKARAEFRPGRPLVVLVTVLGALLAIAPAAGATQYQRPFIEEFGSAEQPSFAVLETVTVDQTTGDVVAGDEGRSEEQEVAVDATAGTYKLSLDGKSTEDIPFDAKFATVRQALETALGVPFGGQGSGEGFDVSPFRIRFSGTLDEEQLTCEDGATPLSGGSGCSVTNIQDGKPGGMYRYHADGTAAPFADLGEAVIDGAAGPGGKPCPEEPASCDRTPQNGIGFRQAGISQPAQVSVDPVTGNIYLTQYEKNLVDIFSSGGEYLGQLTAIGTSKFIQPCGVVVDSAGAVYVSLGSMRIGKFVSSGSGPPVNADGTVLVNQGGFESTCRMALGSGPSAGWLFINNNSGSHPGSRTLKVNTETGEFSEFANGYDRLVAVDPTNGNPIIGAGRSTVEDGDPNPISVGSDNELFEFDGSLESTDTVLSKLVAEDASSVRDFATDAAGKVYVIARGGPESRLLVYGDTPAIVPTVQALPAEDVVSSSARLVGSVNPEGVDVDECFFEWGKGTFSLPNKAPCEESVPTDSSDHTVHATIAGLEPNGIQYSFRLAAKNENGTERSSVERLTTASTVATKAATVTGTSTATLNGELRPEGSPYIDCHFEWGLTSTFGY